MTASKAHRRRKRKGCWVCGIRFERDHTLPTAQRNTCGGCFYDRTLLDYCTTRLDETYFLIVDGSFLTFSGERNVSEPGFGGAGLVLINAEGKVIATKSCGFEAEHSADAEFEAIRRGGRWMPIVTIYSDSQSHVERMRGEMSRDVRYLKKKQRFEAFELAHKLSVEGRLRFQQWFLAQTEEKDDAAGENRGHQEESAPART